MGTTVKILTYTVVSKEVSSCTVGGGEKSMRVEGVMKGDTGGLLLDLNNVTSKMLIMILIKSLM